MSILEKLMFTLKHACMHLIAIIALRTMCVKNAVNDKFT